MATGDWRVFEFSEGTSNKFWRIQLAGDSFTVQYGRIGTQGQEQTKTFGDAAKAQKEYDKLVAEKVKKGYTEVGGTPVSTPAPSAAAPSAPAPAKKAKAAKSEVVATSPAAPATKAAVSVSREVKRELHLDPTDWFAAMWRDPEPLVRPEPPVFDQAERIDRIRKHRGGYPFPAKAFIRASSLTPEEARFWIAAMTTQTSSYGNDHFKTVASELEKKKFHAAQDLEVIKKRLSDECAVQCEEVALCLGALCSPIELYDLIVSDWAIQDRYGSKKRDIHPGWAKWMIPGFCLYVLPYMSRPERDALKSHVKKHLKTLPWSAPGDETVIWAAWMFGGILGLHDEVEKVVKSWPDGALKGCEYDTTYQVLFGLRSGELFQQQWRRLGLSLNDYSQYGRWGRPPSGALIRAWLAHTEYGHLDLVRDAILAQTNKDGCEELLKTFAEVADAPEAASVMLELSLNSKTPRIARKWLDGHVATSVAGLLPLILEKDKLADDAVVFLQDQQHEGHAERIESQIAALPAEPGQAVRQALSGGEGKTFEALTDKTTPKWLAAGLADVPKLAVADFIAMRRLPPITLDGKKLTEEQTQRLLSLLQKASLDKLPKLFDDLKQHADRASLDAFVWNLFEQWLVEANSKHKWAMLALGYLGGDQVALKLTPLVRKWPGESQHQRSVTGLDCLRAIGTDTALMQLNGLAQKVKFKGIKQKAQEYMEQIAQQKGLTRAQLEDRIVPDCDLDERGSRTFDFGPRKFFFQLGSDMKPLVRDEDKKLLKDLPKPGAKDDPVKAEEAVAEWKLLKAQLREVLKLQAGRLEQAMVTGRRWPLAEFDAFLVKHPLMTNLARLVVWGAYDAKGNLSGTFRVTEEQDFADAKDQPYALKATSEVGVVHPLNVDEGSARAWGEVLGDYEIVAPFPQFGRAVYSLENAEKKTNDLTRFRGVKLPAPTLVFTLEKLGWVRGQAMDGGCFDEHSKQFPGGDVTAVVGYEGSVGMGFIDPNELLTIQNVQFVSGMRPPSGYGWDKEKVLKLGDVPPVVMSEVIADVTSLAAKGK